MSPESRSPRSRRRSPDSEASPPSRESADAPLSVRLTAKHDAGNFDSGKPDLNEWLRRSALPSGAAGNRRTWVWAPDGQLVIAYYSVAPHLVHRDQLPKRIARGAQNEIPGYILARLALDQRLQGRGVGSALLADAFARILSATEVVGGRLIVVDAIDDDAAHFYEHHGFVRTTPDRERLVIKVSDVRTSRDAG